MSPNFDFKTEQDVVQAAAMSGELTRLNTRRATKGWLVWIIPGAIVLFVALCYVLQKASGIPFYSTLGLGDCSPSALAATTTEDFKERCESKLDDFSPAERNLARIAVLIAIVVILYFLYDIFAGGPASGLFGGLAGAAPGLQVRPALREEALRTAMTQQDVLQAVQQQQFQYQLPTGTTDSTHVPAAAPSLTGAGAVAPPTSYAAPAPAATNTSTLVATSAEVRDLARRSGFGDLVPTQSSSGTGSGFGLDRTMNIG